MTTKPITYVQDILNTFDINIPDMVHFNGNSANDIPTIAERLRVLSDIHSALVRRAQELERLHGFHADAVKELTLALVFGQGVCEQLKELIEWFKRKPEIQVYFDKALGNTVTQMQIISDVRTQIIKWESAIVSD